MAGLVESTAEAALRSRLADSVANLQTLARSECLAQAVQAADGIVASLRHGGKVLFCGNGGSSMDAGHLAAELLGRFYLDRPALPAISLADATAAMTAIGNDYDFGEVFARQVRGLGRPVDVLVALTTSGNSVNVVRAIEAARDIGMATVALTGAGGGRVAGLADLTIKVPSEDTPRIQEACMHLGHAICELVEEAMFGSGGAVEAASGTGPGPDGG